VLNKARIYQRQSQTGPRPVDSGQKLPQRIDDGWHDIAGREQASVTSWARVARWCGVWRQLTSKFIQTWPVKHICSWHTRQNYRQWSKHVSTFTLGQPITIWSRGIIGVKLLCPDALSIDPNLNILSSSTRLQSGSLLMNACRSLYVGSLTLYTKSSALIIITHISAPWLKT